MSASRSVLPAATRSIGRIQDGPGFSDSEARWREEVFRNDLYEISGVERAFHFGWDAVVTPEVSLTRFDAVGLSYAREASRIRADGHDGVRVQLTYTGGFTGLLGDLEVVAGPGAAVLVDQTLPFFNRSVDTRGLTLALPRSAFGGADVRSLHGRLISGAAFARLNDWLTLQSRALRTTPASTMDQVTAAMGAVVHGAFDAAVEPTLQESGALDELAIVRLRALAVRERVDVRAAARAVGVSRSALYRAAAPFGGVMEVVWGARLDAVHAALVSPGPPRSLSELAEAFCFSDAAHLHRRFRARFGFKAGDLRPIGI